MSQSRPGGRTSSASAIEVASLAERMGYMQSLRAGFTAVVLLTGLFSSVTVSASLADLMLVSTVYLTLTAASETARRFGKGRGLGVVGGMLLIDGAFLAWVMYATGGVDSPLRFLVYMHLIAVTLLASYRTGLKIALWHSLLFFAVFYAQVAGILETLDADSPLFSSEAEFYRASVFNVTAFWLVALGTAAFSALNERELRRRQADLQSLSEMGPEMEQATDPEAIAGVLLDRVFSTFGFRRGVVIGKHDDRLPLLAYRGPGEPVELNERLDPIVDEVWTSRTSKLLKKVDPDQNPRLASLLPMARNVVITPLFAEGRPVGVLVAEYASGDRIERRVVTMLSQFTSHAALEIKNAWLLGQIQKMARSDALTGLANRVTFETTLEKELSRSARSGDPVTLAMFDLDHFKNINDTHGHQAGDRVLRAVAESIAKDCRDFDTAARFGGEEFAVILPACGPRDALAVVERIRQSIAKIKAAEPITASAGVATFPTHAGTATALIKAADEALYESKRAGRDRVTRSRRKVTRRTPTPRASAAARKPPAGRPDSPKAH